MRSPCPAARRSAALACTSVILAAGSAAWSATSALAADTPVPPTVANTAPVATPDRATTSQGQPVTIDLLANDTDPDGDALSVLGATSAARGTLSFTGDLVTYAPDADFVGVDSFAYTVGDGRGGDATASVTLTVEAPAGAPPPGDTAPDPVDTDPAPVPVPVLPELPARTTVPAPPARPVPAPPVAEPASPETAGAEGVAAQPAPPPVRRAGTVAAAPATVRPAATTTGPQPQLLALPATGLPRSRPAAGGAAPMVGPPTGLAPVAGAGQPSTLPFTGAATDRLLPPGLVLLVTGVLLTLVGRRPAARTAV